MSTTKTTIPANVPENGYIESQATVCGGKPCITGTRIRVQDIAILAEHGGLSADEIIREYPQLSLAQVHAALAYYFDHLSSIRDDIDRSEAIAEAMRAKHGSPLQEKLRHLRGTDAENDPLSP